MTPLNSFRQDIYTRHTEEHPVSRCSQSEMRQQLQLRVPFSVALPRTAACLSARQPWSSLSMASTITSAEPIPFCTSGSVWQWEGVALRRHSSNSSRGWQKHMGGGGMGKLGNGVESRGLGWFYPASKLRGLPAHLPRNLASFSPRVDDRDGGGSWPRWLSNHLWFLSHRRRVIRVLIVHFNSRG